MNADDARRNSEVTESHGPNDTRPTIAGHPNEDVENQLLSSQQMYRRFSLSSADCELFARRERVEKLRKSIEAALGRCEVMLSRGEEVGAGQVEGDVGHAARHRRRSAWWTAEEAKRYVDGCCYGMAADSEDDDPDPDRKTEIICDFPLAPEQDAVKEGAVQAVLVLFKDGRSLQELEPGSGKRNHLLIEVFGGRLSEPVRLVRGGKEITLKTYKAGEGEGPQKLYITAKEFQELCGKDCLHRWVMLDAEGRQAVAYVKK